MGANRPLGAIRVLHAAETVKGGVGTVMRQLLQVKDSIVPGDYILRCIVPETEKDMLRSLDGNVVQTFEDRGRGIVSLCLFTKKFILQVLRFRPHIVHLHSSFAGFVGRVVLLLMRPWIRTKIVYCPHAFAFLMPGSKYKKRIYSFVEKVLSHLCDKIICVSQFEKEAAVRVGIDKKKLLVVHNGVAPKPVILERDFVSDDTKIRLLFVGRFDYQKGFDLLLDAMPYLEDARYRINIIGGAVRGKAEIPLKQVNVNYIGWVQSEDLDPYYRDADVLVFPSRWEGFAMVPLEAMSCGLPVLASDCAPNDEIIVDGMNGHFFKSGDSFDLLKKIKENSLHDWRSMRKRCAEFINDRFTEDLMIGAIYDMYGTIILGLNR